MVPIGPNVNLLVPKGEDLPLPLHSELSRAWQAHQKSPQGGNRVAHKGRIGQPTKETQGPIKSGIVGRSENVGTNLKSWET